MGIKARALYTRQFAASGGGLPPGFQRWSNLATWGGSFPAQAVDLMLGAGSKIYYDIAMTDASAPGKIRLAAGAQMIVDPTLPTRLVSDSLIIDGGQFSAGTVAQAHASTFRLDLCGARPTVSGNAGGGPLKFGQTHDLTTDASTGNNGTTNDNGGLSRALMVMGGGKLILNGSVAPINTRLAAAYTSGSTIQVSTPVTAPAGATVLVSPDGHFDPARRTEVRTLAVAATSATTLTLNAPLGFARFGQLQYATDGGISLTSAPFTLRTVGDPAGMRTSAAQNPVLDGRAFVIIMAPQIKVSGYDLRNTDLATFGYGFHGMSMDLTTQTFLRNVGMEDYGQLGLLGRYGWHWHRGSFNDDGTSRTDGAGGTNVFPSNFAVMDGCTGLRGRNRFATIHAACGTKVTRCIAHDSAGHAFFHEDGPEIGGEMSYNVSLSHRDPGPTQRLKAHDAVPVGFWWSNPEHIAIENWGVDSIGSAWANAHSFGLQATQVDAQHGCLGASENVPICPGTGKRGNWDGNSSLSCFDKTWSRPGPSKNNGQEPPAGTTSKLRCTTDGLATFVTSGYQRANDITLQLRNARWFSSGGYNNVVGIPEYFQPVFIEHTGTQFSGTTWAQDTVRYGGILDPIAGITTNHPDAGLFASTRRCAVVSYHGTLGTIGGSFYNYSGAHYSTNGGNGGGTLEKTCVQESWDNYTDPVHIYSIASPGWAMLNSDASWMTPPAHLTEQTTTYDALTGAAAGGPKFVTLSSGARRPWSLGMTFDAFGLLGTSASQAGVPNSHIIFNQPFFTTGLSGLVTMAHNPQSIITTKPFFGVQILPNTGAIARSRHVFQRVTSTGTDIAGAVWDMPAYNPGDLVLQFHHGACPIGGFVRFKLPDFSPPTVSYSGNFTVAGVYDAFGKYPYTNPYINEATDVTYWGFDWGGATATFTGDGQVYDSTGVTSLATLVSSTGFKKWLDTANKILWVRLRIHKDQRNWTIAP